MQPGGRLALGIKAFHPLSQRCLRLARPDHGVFPFIPIPPNLHVTLLSRCTITSVRVVSRFSPIPPSPLPDTPMFHYLRGVAQGGRSTEVEISLPSQSMNAQSSTWVICELSSSVSINKRPFKLIRKEGPQAIPPLDMSKERV